jgi:hypothetical protein
MPNLPNLAWLFPLAGIGLVAIAAGGGWLAYHLVRAVLFYMGVL